MACSLKNIITCKPETELLAIKMDEKAFKKFLKRNHLAPKTIGDYVYFVKKIEKWLLTYQGKKKLEDANESDIRNWKSYVQKEKGITTYFYGIREYYRYKRNDVMVNTINEILSELPRPPPTPQRSFRWTDFKEVMSKAEGIGISDRDRALLNLLWSEMNSSTILGLFISDIDFEKRLIASLKSEETYNVTQEAWDAMEKYVPIEDRSKKRPLFTINPRRLQQITKKYFESVKQTPKSLMLSCQENLIDAGKTLRFVTEPDKRLTSREEQEQIEKSRTGRGLFNKLVQEIKNFRSRVHNKFSKIKDEEEFQTLLEGYLLATFPDEIITPEFRFKGYEITDSIIDLAVGKDPKIPIEVKLAKKKMKPYLREGIGQVTEFLKYSESKKGILVIGDQKRDPERRKLSGMQDNVYIIVI